MTFLNEVLSLNAQELHALIDRRKYYGFLNEVLSLNAQEWQSRASLGLRSLVLNEVLSLNAQECSALFIESFTIFPQ